MNLIHKKLKVENFVTLFFYKAKNCSSVLFIQGLSKIGSYQNF